ncbi:MAG: AAA family ATPase [Candidatus Hermodarchaeota archaeon]
MKIAFVGKGGVGKTLLSSLFARWLAKRGDKVFAVDVDSNPNLAFALGVPNADKIISLTENEKLIKERTELPMGLIKLNPTVKDLGDKYAVDGPDGIKLLVAGHIETAQGCMCGAHSLIKALLRHLTIKNEHIIFDMQAGLESFGRGTIQHMNGLVIVSELASRSLVTVERIINLAKEMDLNEKNLFLVFNKAQPAQLEQVGEFTKSFNIPTAVLPYSDVIVKADLQGSVSDILETEAQSSFGKELGEIFERVIAHFQ